MAQRIRKYILCDNTPYVMTIANLNCSLYSIDMEQSTNTIWALGNLIVAMPLDDITDEDVDVEAAIEYCKTIITELIEYTDINVFNTWVDVTNELSNKGSNIISPVKKVTPVKTQKQPVKQPVNTEVTLDSIILTEKSKKGILQLLNFSKRKQDYIDIGARVPKAVLLYGAPGTGKTSIGRAIAAESGRPFIAKCASEFANKYVGSSAESVRKVFKEARDKRAVLFIDEIDAIGGKRDSGGDNANGEYATLLNELLSQLDGFNSNEDIIIIATTNRIDILDPALTRAGRFDRKYEIDLPDEQCRKQIFDLYLAKMKHGIICTKELATQTKGKSGADIELICNEAALLAVDNNSKIISQEHIEQTMTDLFNIKKKEARKIGFVGGTN